MTINKTSHKLLLAVCAAAAVDPGYYMTTKKAAKQLIDASLVQFNDNITDGDKVAFKPTDAGVEAAKEPAPASSLPDASEFQLDTGFTPAATQRLGGKQSVYPFEKMDLGVSFFVAATEARPNPAKSLASTVSSANQRYEKQEPRRYFVVRAVDETEQGRGKGARVYRIDPPAASAPAPAPQA